MIHSMVDLPTQKSTTETQRVHFLHRRAAIDIVGQYHQDPIPNFHPQARPSNSKPTLQARSPTEWLQKQTALGLHGNQYRDQGNTIGVRYQPHGYYKEGTVKTIETKEYRIYEPTE